MSEQIYEENKRLRIGQEVETISQGTNCTPEYAGTIGIVTKIEEEYAYIKIIKTMAKHESVGSEVRFGLRYWILKQIIKDWDN